VLSRLYWCRGVTVLLPGWVTWKIMWYVLTNLPLDGWLVSALPGRFPLGENGTIRLPIFLLILFFFLKVPKCEIFHRSDFQDFYTIKPFWVGDFGVKKLTCYFNFWGSWASFNFWACASVPDAYAQCTHQLLTRTHNARISSWRAHSLHASVPYSCAQRAHKDRRMRVRKSTFLNYLFYLFLKRPFQIWNFYTYAEHTRKKLMHMHRVRISSWPVCSVCASVPDPYAQRTYQFLTHMLGVRIISWCACSVRAAVSYEHAEGIKKICVCWACA
jgi:hypothetical protein